MPIDEIVQRIRRKSREEWTELVREGWTELRIWVQEHGEIAALTGVVIGMLFVLAFRFVVGFIILATLAGYVIWNIAEPAEARRRERDDDPTGSDSAGV